MPKISVILPVYNAARYLPLALRSLLAQTERDFEIVAVDDGSTDASLSMLQDTARRDARLKIISRPNTGIVGALNDGIAAASGTYLARMDGDDIAFPERFARQLRYMETHPDCVCVGSAYIYIDAVGAPLKLTPRPLTHEAIEAGLLRGDGGSLIHPVVMMRASAVAAAGGYRESAQWVEDLDLYLRLARIGRLANLAEPLLYYRFHTASVNFTKNDAARLERKRRLLTEAHAVRGIDYDPKSYCAPVRDRSRLAAEAREFATSSLAFRSKRTPWRYAFQALRLMPRSRASWTTLSYVAKAGIGMVKVRPHPTEVQLSTHDNA
ncbi:MAG TPA: glycosyltransferase [Candidatus Synoicihabitans sp.]|nr:glycosyltransferase [Candidatus Synoicihabitans sp.]